MDSAVSRILKAKQYATERDKRVKVHSFEVELHGDNANHIIKYNAGEWKCDCEEAVAARRLRPYHGHGRNFGGFGRTSIAGDRALRFPKTKYKGKGRPDAGRPLYCAAGV